MSLTFVPFGGKLQVLSSYDQSTKTGWLIGEIREFDSATPYAFYTDKSSWTAEELALLEEVRVHLKKMNKQ